MHADERHHQPMPRKQTGHPREFVDPARDSDWTPAFAGATGFALDRAYRHILAFIGG